MDCSARDVRDRWLLHDIRMLECVVAKVQVWSMAFHDGDDGVFCYTEQIDGYIGAGAGSVSRFDRHKMLVSTYTEAPITTTRYSPTISKITTTKPEAQLTFPR